MRMLIFASGPTVNGTVLYDTRWGVLRSRMAKATPSNYKFIHNVIITRLCYTPLVFSIHYNLERNADEQPHGAERWSRR